MDSLNLVNINVNNSAIVHPVPGATNPPALTFPETSAVYPSTPFSEQSQISTMKLSNGSTYVGTLLNGMMHGHGEIRSRDGILTYKGGFLAGQSHGYGVALLTNGDIYKGQYQNGVWCGHGVLTTKQNGAIYEGPFVDGLQHGQGIRTYQDGSVFSATFANGYAHGKATLTLDNGDSFECLVEKGLQIVKKLTSGEGSRKIHTKKCEDGSVYKGPMALGLFHGKGELEKPGGCKYSGDFALGFYHGNGVLDCFEDVTAMRGYPTGSVRMIREGTFESGWFVKGKTTVIYPDGKSYSIEMDGNDLDGSIEELKRDLEDRKRPSSAPVTTRQKLKQKLINRNVNTLRSAIENYKDHLEQIQKALIAQIRDSIKETQNNKLTAEERKKRSEAEIDAVVKSLGEWASSSSSTGPAKKKEKSNASLKGKVGVASSASISSSSSSSSSNAVLSKLDTSFWMPFKEAPTCHRRVLRWKEKDVGNIERFADWVNGQPVYKYRRMSEDREEHVRLVKQQRMYHFLPGLERLLVTANENRYYTRTEHPDHAEYHMIATLIIDGDEGQEEKFEFGDITIAVNKQNEIYHKKFDPWPLEVDEEGKTALKNRFLQGRNEALPEEEAGNNQHWKPVDASAIERLPNGNILLTFNEKYKLEVSYLV